MRKFLTAAVLVAASFAAFGQAADSLAPSSSPAVETWNYLSNATSWDRQRANLSSATAVTALAAVGLGTVNGSDLVNFNARGVKLVIDITALTGTGPTLTVTIQGKDAVSGKYYTILASAALAAVATTVLTVYPAVTVAANVSASDILPRDWRVSYTVGGTTPAVTATIGVAYVN